jgi:hypothetical protein
MASLEAKASKKQALQEEARLRKLVVKLEKAAKSKARAEERAANKRYNDYWKKVKRDGWGDNLHNLIKASMRNPTPNLRTPQNLVVPNICRYNQKIALLHRRFKREGKDLRLVAPAMNVQQCLRDQCWNAHAWPALTWSYDQAPSSHLHGHIGTSPARIPGPGPGPFLPPRHTDDPTHVRSVFMVSYFKLF